LSYRRPKKSIFHHNGGHVPVAETHPPSWAAKTSNPGEHRQLHGNARRLLRLESRRRLDLARRASSRSVSTRG